MQDAKQDVDFDPWRSDHKTGKDDKFVKVKHGTLKPKNPLTVTYLCFAFDVPYATFKRWKSDAFVTKKHVPEHKGKSVLTDKVWASKVYNARRIYITHCFAAWIHKYPTKKNDVNAKKVRTELVPSCNILLRSFTISCITCLKLKKQNLKDKWATLTEEEKIPFEKMQRDHMAQQAHMKDAITDALSKQKGGNCVRSYASIAKVLSVIASKALEFVCH